jgi:hypothetical protein
MPELDETAAIRRLPDGAALPARIRRRDADRLVVALAVKVSGDRLEVGALVEIQSSSAIYLGEVASIEQDAQVTVAVEHFIDKAALEKIEQVWATS